MSSSNLFYFILFASFLHKTTSADEPQYRTYFYIDSHFNISKGGDSKLRRPVHQISSISVINPRRFTTIDGIVNHRISNICNNNISTPLLNQASSIVLFIPLYVSTPVSVRFLVFYSFICFIIDYNVLYF